MEHFSEQNNLFIKACLKQNIERTPIWIMRQAGRYLPEYRAVREKVDFLTLCKTPELAAEVTIQPVDILNVDAAIIFSDILVVPEAMGMQLTINENVGPVFANPIRSGNDVNELIKIDTELSLTKLKFVFDAIKLTKKKLNNRVPLIGFSGSPFTLLTYMVEGKISKNFSQIKKFIYDNSKLAHKVLEKLSDIIAQYLSLQIDAGANAIQIFDTWGGILSPYAYNDFSLKYISETIKKIKRENQPIIIFAKGISDLEKLKNIGADVISIDWTLDIGQVRKQIGNQVALQGNLDPTVLYTKEETIKNEAKKILESFGKGSGHIFNLGHGILPDIEVEKVKCLINFVKEESKKFHL